MRHVIGGEVAGTSSFGGADITARLDSEANRLVRASLPRAPLLIASYVVAENALALEASGCALRASELLRNLRSWQAKRAKKEAARSAGGVG